MNILNSREETRYDVTIRFRTYEGAKRSAICGYMPRREYKRMNKEILQGKSQGIYQFVIDGHTTEVLFPLYEIDTVFALPETSDE